MIANPIKETLFNSTSLIANICLEMKQEQLQRNNQHIL